MIKIKRMLFEEDKYRNEGKLILKSIEEFYSDCVYFADIRRICEDDTHEQAYEIKYSLERSLPCGWSYKENYLGIYCNIPEREKITVDKEYVIIGTELITKFCLVYKDNDGDLIEHYYVIRYSLHPVE